MNLSKDAVAKITIGGVSAKDGYQPLLQVTELKQVQTKQPQQYDRYRLVLSDGSHLQQGMLGTQVNHLVNKELLRSGSIVKLLQYTCTTVQGRMIIIILDLEVVVKECALIGNPVPSSHKPPVQPTTNQNPATDSMQAQRPNQPYTGSYDAGRNPQNSPSFPPRAETNPGFSPPTSSGFHNQRPSMYDQPPSMYAQSRPPGYQPPPPMYTNRGPIAKNEAPARIIPIAALNPYQGRWTIKARVTAKGELRFYNNPRGEGKVFSFDLLDSDGGEIRVTCFNAVADQFYHQIETGRVYLISKGTLKPAQKNFNHLHNDLEIFLESMSTVQPCYEDDTLIPKQQFHFRCISDIENMETNSVVDVIGVVFSVAPASTIMRKNSTETRKRTLQMKDMSGKSVELTLWGNVCDTEGQRLQDMSDSGLFPVLAVKSCRVNDFNGKAVSTIGTSQIFIEPDFPEASQLRDWFGAQGRNAPTVSISREITSSGRPDTVKTIAQIKDEKLGTSEKPDWISINATVIFIKADNFCYTACPILVGDRVCNKKVISSGDGQWRCERCDRVVNEIDYRYILQLQIQDHTGLTWVTAFQESGEDIMGISAKDLYFMKYEKQDDDGFAKVLRGVLFARFTFKLKVKEEVFSDEQRVKSTVVKAEKVDYPSNSRYLLEAIQNLMSPNSSFTPGIPTPSNEVAATGYGNRQAGQQVPYFTGPTYTGASTYINKQPGLSASQVGQSVGHHSNNFSAPLNKMCCDNCGATGHASANCPSMVGVRGSATSGYSSYTSGGGSGSTSGECYKCHQHGHWARDCPGSGTIPPVHGSSGASYSGGPRGFSRQQFGGY